VSIARRGDTVWDVEAFTAHLSQAVMLEHVGVMLGAGASLGCGGKTMAGLWGDFSTGNPDAVTRLTELGFITLMPGVVPNVETLLDQLTVAVMDAKRRSLIRGQVAQIGPPTLEELKNLKTSVLRAVLRASLLGRAWLSNPESAASAEALQAHVKMLTRLVYTRQPGQPSPWVFTTNYDMAIELAAENASLNVRDGFRGFHNREFSSSSFDLGLRNTEARGEAQFGTYEIYLAKMHGSLSWEATDDGNVRALQISAVCNQLFSFADGATDESPSVLIYPSSAKFVDTVGFVYGEMIRRFTHFLSRPNVCLIVNGYGFGDHHLNRVLLSALNNPTLQLIIYLPEIISFDGNGSPISERPLNAAVSRLLNLKLPQVTVLGGGSEAYFDKLATHLPDPTVLDDPAARARKLGRALAEQLQQGDRAS